MGGDWESERESNVLCTLDGEWDELETSEEGDRAGLGEPREGLEERKRGWDGVYGWTTPDRMCKAQARPADDGRSRGGR